MEVFGRLVVDYVDQVVNGDDARHASVGVDDRNRHEVVLGHHLCDFFLVHRGGHRNYLGAHDVGDDRIGLGQKQLPHAHHAHQPAGPVDDVNVGYGLRAGAYLADMLQNLLDGHAGADADVLHRHEAAGGVFGIVQEPLDYTGVLGRKQVDELLRLLHGRTVEGHKLITDGAPVREMPMDARERVLNRITDPNIAYILMMIAIYGIIAELQNPGLIFPGTAGVTALLLALYSFAVLPINTVGVLLILLGVGLMIADIKVPSHGILTAAGAVAFGFGSFMLVRSPDPFLRVSLRLILATTVFTTLFFAFIVGAGLRAQRLRVATGIEGLLGEPVLAKTDLAPDGQVLAEGELWSAENVGEEPIREGDQAVVVAVDGFVLKVRKET